MLMDDKDYKQLHNLPDKIIVNINMNKTFTSILISDPLFILKAYLQRNVIGRDSWFLQVPCIGRCNTWEIDMMPSKHSSPVINANRCSDYASDDNGHRLYSRGLE